MTNVTKQQAISTDAILAADPKLHAMWNQIVKLYDTNPEAMQIVLDLDDETEQEPEPEQGPGFKVLDEMPAEAARGRTSRYTEEMQYARDNPGKVVVIAASAGQARWFQEKGFDAVVRTVNGQKVVCIRAL